jgi:hypothetical protein
MRVAGARAGRARLVIVVAWTATAVGAHATIAAAATEPAARQYARDARITEGEADRRLDVQARAATLSADLSAGRSERFAGVWIERSTGRVGVGVLADSDRGWVNRAIRAHGLVSDADVVAVASSVADLNAAQFTLDTELARPIGNRQAETQVDVAGNEVVLRLNTGATPRVWAQARLLRAQFAAGREAYGPALPPVNPSPSQPAGNAAPQPSRLRVVVVRIVAAPKTIARPAVCSTESCSPPLRAGVKLVNNGDGRMCSAGFIGRWWSGSRYEYFTESAGHCIKGTNSRWYWRAYDPKTGGSGNVGRPWSWRFGSTFGNVYPGLSLDIGVVHIDSGGHWGAPVANALWMHGWPTGARWSVAGRAPAIQGQYACRTGYARPFSCGFISSTSATAGYGLGEGGVTNLLVVPSACGMPGDSGGALVDGGNALGITSGAARYAGGACAWGYFARADDVARWLGVQVLTS